VGSDLRHSRSHVALRHHIAPLRSHLTIRSQAFGTVRLGKPQQPPFEHLRQSFISRLLDSAAHMIIVWGLLGSAGIVTLYNDVLEDTLLEHRLSDHHYIRKTLPQLRPMD
jgi:hypothetical protein